MRSDANARLDRSIDDDEKTRQLKRTDDKVERSIAQKDWKCNTQHNINKGNESSCSDLKDGVYQISNVEMSRVNRGIVTIKVEVKVSRGARDEVSLKTEKSTPFLPKWIDHQRSQK